MTDDLMLVAAVIGEPPNVSSDVLRRAHETAGLPVPQQLSPEPLVLQPRLARRKRRRVVSLTMALAACVAAITVDVAVHQRQPSRLLPSAGAGFPTDAQLASATSFHLAFHAADESCPTSEDDYYLNNSTIGGSLAVHAAPCGHTTEVYGGPEITVASVAVKWSDLPHVSHDPAVLTAQIEAHDGGAVTENNVDSVVNNAVNGFGAAPLPAALRSALVSVIEARPSVTSSAGHDVLGRPVTWLDDHTGDAWFGIDPTTDWIIAYGNGAAAADGGPSKPGNVVTTIDTAQPPADVSPTGHLVGTITSIDGTGLDSEVTVTGARGGDINLHADLGHFTIDLVPGRYTVTGSIDGSGVKLRPQEMEVGANATKTFAETVLP